MAKHFITSLTILIVTLLAAPNMLAADRVVTGVVVSSEDSEPLIGASVAVSQSQLKEANSSLKTLGVVTDLDGKFSITIPDAVKQLEIRYVGYNPRTIELVPGLDNYDLQLDRASEVLSDVVVTGYQNIEKRKLTASITKVELDDSKLGSIMTVDQALAGQVARPLGDTEQRLARRTDEDTYPRHGLAQRHTGPSVGHRRYTRQRHRGAHARRA